MAKIGHMKWSRCTGFFPGLSKWGDVHNGHDRQTKHQFGSLDVRTKLTHSYGSTGWTWLVAMFNPGKLSRKKSVDKNITSTKTGPLEGKLSSNHEFAGAVSFREGKHSPKHHDFFWRMAAYPFIKRIRGGIPWFFFISPIETPKNLAYCWMRGLPVNLRGWSYEKFPSSSLPSPILSIIKYTEIGSMAEAPQNTSTW